MRRILSPQLKLFFERYTIYLILAFTFLVRFIGLNFGLPYLYNYDEKWLVNPAIRILVTGDLNPHWFCHPGSFIIYLLAILFAIILGVYFIYCFLHGYAHNLAEFKYLVKSAPVFYYDKIPVLFHFIGRLLIVSSAVITVYLVYLTAKKLFNRQVAILAAFCLSISPFYIIDSRFVRSDIPATMLVMFSVYFLFRFIDEGKVMKWLVLSSLFAGFSIAAKYTSGIIVFPILIHCLITDSKETRPSVAHLSRALLFIFVGFFIFAPFAVLDFPHSIGDIISEVTKTQIGHERLAGIQNYIWYLRKAGQGGMGGLFFAIFAVLGLCLILLKKSYRKYLLLVFPLLYFMAIGAGKLKWERWFIPVYPFEAILFGVGFYGLYKIFIQAEEFRDLKPRIILLFTIVMIYASSPVIIDEVKEAIILTRLDTRTIAKDWVENNLPRGAKIAYEEGTALLDINPKGNFNLMDVGAKAIVYEPLSYYQKQSVDYIIITDFLRVALYREPDRYANEISRYKELKNKTELIKRIDRTGRPGPVIQIYKLKKD